VCRSGYLTRPAIGCPPPPTRSRNFARISRGVHVICPSCFTQPSHAFTVREHGVARAQVLDNSCWVRITNWRLEMLTVGVIGNASRPSPTWMAKRRQGRGGYRRCIPSFDGWTARISRVTYMPDFTKTHSHGITMSTICRLTEIAV